MRRAVVPVVLAALAAGPGCTGAEEVEVADYRAQAASLCAQAARAGADAEVARRRLVTLVPPPELAARHEELRDIEGIVERVGRNAARGNVSPARALERIRRVRARARRIYASIGVRGC